jgi:pyruvate dehydrogenase E2 component (dihydrolipoamide acetyltransferase)
VRKLARELGVDLQRVTPTGPRGRIRREDVLQAAESPATAATPTLSPSEALPATERDEHGPVEPLVLPALRRTIAAAMVRAATTAVPVTTTDEADVTDLAALRQRSKDVAASQGVQVTLLPFLMKAVVAALRQHPQLNATLADDQHHLLLKRYYHLGIATAVPDGLVVPVIRHADRLTVLQLAHEIQRLAGQAQERKLSLEELSGSTFTITNFGSFGGQQGTPIINPPEVAILGCGRIEKKAVVVEDQVVARPMLPLALSFDHRLIDGAAAGQFLARLKALLVDPNLLFLELV